MKIKVDLNYFLNEVSDDPVFINMMITTFIDAIQEYQLKMKEYIPNGNFESVHQVAHKLKPSLQMFGLNEFFELHDQIVESSRNHKNTEMIHDWFALQDEMIPLIINELKNTQKLYV